MITQVMVELRAEELGLKKRTHKELLKMKPGYYMDMNCNLAVVKEIKPLVQEGREGMNIDADVISAGMFSDLINQEGIPYWEYLGEL